MSGDMYDAAVRQIDRLEDKAERLRATIKELRAINAELRERLNCSYCWEHRDDLMMPPHTASVNCESGNRNHCTCSACF